MSEYILRNEKASVRVDSLGAELKSFRGLSEGREYMWQADPAYWKRTSPVLFPLVGNYKNKCCVYDGKTYSLSQHGFARDREFVCFSRTEDTLWFALESDEETRKMWPFSFRLELGYRLRERSLEVLWRVINTDSREMYFSIGGHPAFNCPPGDGVSKEGCYLQFDADSLVKRLIGPDGLATDEFEELKLDEGRLKITDELFDQDALVMEGDQAHQVTLADRNKTPFVTVRFDAPLFGVWSPVGKKAPFVCIEPWYGRCDHKDFEGMLEEREWGRSLPPGEVFDASYQIILPD